MADPQGGPDNTSGAIPSSPAKRTPVRKDAARKAPTVPAKKAPKEGARQEGARQESGQQESSRESGQRIRAAGRARATTAPGAHSGSTRAVGRDACGRHSHRSDERC